MVVAQFIVSKAGRQKGTQTRVVFHKISGGILLKEGVLCMSLVGHKEAVVTMLYTSVPLHVCR